MDREQDIDREHGDHLLCKRHLLIYLDGEFSLIIQPKDLDNLILVADSSVLRFPICVAQLKFGGGGEGQVRFIAFVGQHSDLIRLLFVDETLDHVRDDRSHDTLLCTDSTSCILVLFPFEQMGRQIDPIQVGLERIQDEIEIVSPISIVELEVVSVVVDPVDVWELYDVPQLQ